MFFTRFFVAIMMLVGLAAMGLGFMFATASEPAIDKILGAFVFLAGTVVTVGAAIIDSLIAAILLLRDELRSRLR